jgi:hypothetical protein
LNSKSLVIRLLFQASRKLAPSRVIWMILHGSVSSGKIFGTCDDDGASGSCRDEGTAGTSEDEAVGMGVVVTEWRCL